MSQSVGRLVLDRRIGAGGFATVWLARDPDLDALVAVKILAENWATHADVRRRFADEARLLRRVDSDRVVRVYDVGTLDDGRPYLVMTYADGGSLHDRMASHGPPWPVDAVLAVVDAVAAGLQALHAHGIVHRDVGPRNILFRRRPAGAPGEDVLLGDLGIAKDLHWASGLTQPAGTSGFQAPEQMAFTADVRPATDVYGLAITAGRLLGVPGPPWPATALGDVLSRATAADPGQRTATAPAFAQDLRAVLTPPQPSPAAPPPPSPPPPSARPIPRSSPGVQEGRRSGRRPVRRRVLAAGVLAAALTVTAAGYAALRDRDLRVLSERRAVAVTMPGDWSPSAVLAPGESNGEGVRMVAGRRSVSAAIATTSATPAEMAGRVRPAGCTRSESMDVTAERLRGAVTVWSQCPNGEQVSLAGLADPDDTGWVVWVEVRSVQGSPLLKDVLSRLTVDAGRRA